MYQQCDCHVNSSYGQHERVYADYSTWSVFDGLYDDYYMGLT